jgi:hypothetical protein
VSDGGATYATARSGGALTLNSGLNSFQVGQGVSAGYECYEGFISFDTSSVVGTVSEAALSIVVGENYETATDFTCNARRLDWGTLTTADWIAGASLSGQALLATFATSGFVENSYNVFTSQAGFLTNINPSGMTGIILSFNRHEGNNSPVSQERVDFKSAEIFRNVRRPEAGY